MPETTLATLHGVANVIVAATALTVAAVIALRTSQRPAARREPLGIAFGLVFLAIGVNAITRVTFRDGIFIVVTDWLAVAAMIAFLLLHRRYGVFIESAHMVREFETEYAAKDREARALAQVNEELRRLDELKSEFLAMVSHELRTPLTAIIGYSRLLIRQAHGTLTPKQLDHHEAIFRSAQRLSDLINDLLDVSRLEAGRVELSPRPTHLRQAIDQVITVVSVAAQARQIRIENAVPPDAPLVHADPSRLQQ